MEKVAILTWCDNNGPTNYGQILQCYAMQYLVKSWGYEPFVVQYRRKDARDICKYHFSNRSALGRFLNEKYERYYNIKVVEKKETIRVKRFKRFIEEHIVLSAPCYTKAMVEDMTKECTMLVCGSDQIWNPVWFDPIFFLDFGTQSQKRIAYAPSGVFYDNASNAAIYRRMASLIEQLDEVSVRERRGQQILARYTDKPITVKVDPTYSVPVEEWDRIAAPRLLEEDYVFCYIIGAMRPWQLILRKALEICGVRKLIFIPSNIAVFQNFSFAETYEDAGPAEFISLIKHAKAVITDSFHGTVFSILYQKPFCNVKRYQPGTESFGGGERIEGFLQEIGMESHSVCNVKELVALWQNNK